MDAALLVLATPPIGPPPKTWLESLSVDALDWPESDWSVLGWPILLWFDDGSDDPVLVRVASSPELSAAVPAVVAGEAAPAAWLGPPPSNMPAAAPGDDALVTPAFSVPAFDALSDAEFSDPPPREDAPGIVPPPSAAAPAIPATPVSCTSPTCSSLKSSPVMGSL